MTLKKPPLLVVDGDSADTIVAVATSRGWRVVDVRDGFRPSGTDVAAVAVDGAASTATWRERCPHALILALSSNVADADVPRIKASALLNRVLDQIGRTWIAQRDLRIELDRSRERIRKLSDIGVALSAQTNPDRLLETILTEARTLADCEAGSLYLVDPRPNANGLIFKLAQNDVVPVELREERLPMSRESISGYVALTGQELNIEDAYSLPEDAPYSFNRSFDERMGFRTSSMFVLPMRDHRARLIGVLLFINRRGTSVDGSSRIVPFDEEICELLRAVASQAAVSIQKSGLIRDINQLFESFVQASVKAIEQRDPTTSGHSFRVAETTVALLSALPQSNIARFSNLTFTDEHITEVRYAALLHDFGKVGVREKVLVKANKLTDERLEILRYRFELQKERLRRAAVEQELALLHHAQDSFETVRRRVRRELAQKLSMIDDYYAAVVAANNPNMIADGDFGHLRTVRDYRFRELDGSLSGLITDADLLALSMRQGSLTPEERREIQLHVVHTKEFLSVLPWPPELARVPEIAGAHHEKLDGSGYPEGLSGEEIPLASRVMTVADIFDALTAMDRPYKSAMSLDTALRILESEANDGLLDVDVVRVFIEARCFESAARRLGPKPVRRPAVLLRAAR
jgi:HD-GYP domain-containing protein (c-di-GMP phosphodiesterase class II)